MYQKDFLGSGWSFPLRVDPRTGHIAMAEGEESIRQSIGIILRTYRGERVMRSDFGSSTPDYAFAPANYALKESIAYELSRQVVLQEPRVRDVQVTCDEPSGQDGRLILQVSYTVRSTNNRYNHVYPFWMGQGEGE